MAVNQLSLDGWYTRMLHVLLNIWSEHVTNEKLYGWLPWFSDRVASRTMQFAGHCDRHQELADFSYGSHHVWRFWRGMLGWRALRSWPDVWMKQIDHLALAAILN